MASRDLPAALRSPAAACAAFAAIFGVTASQANIPNPAPVYGVTQIEGQFALAGASVVPAADAPVLIRVASSKKKKDKDKDKTKSSTPSMGDSITDNAQTAKDNVESSASGAVNDSVNSVSTSASSAITSGMTGLQDKLLRKKSGKSDAAAAATTATGKPAIMDEGDGKHSILVTPGKSEVLELTPVQGSKTVFIEEATGDKYIVMPNGDINRVLQKNTAK